MVKRKSKTDQGEPTEQAVAPPLSDSEEAVEEEDQAPELAPIDGLDMEYAAEWRPVFLETLADTCNVRLSCEAAEIDRRTAYKHKRLDPVFSELWSEALDDAVQLLEGAAFDRALQVSDTMLIFLLKTHKPDKYNPVQKHELSGPGGAPIDIGSSAERDKRLADLIGKAVADGNATDDVES